MSGIEHHEACKFPRGGSRDDFAVKAALGQERQPAAMVEVRVSEEHIIDAGGVKTERRGVVDVEFAAALKQTAIDQHAFARAFDQMARPGNVTIRSVKR